VCNHSRDNERKLKITIFSFCSRGITLSKTSRQWPNSNLTCAFLWRTHTCNLNLIHASKQKLESGNYKFQFFSKFKRDNSIKNQWINQIRTWPTHFYDEPTHAIWTLYIHPNKTYRAETEILFKRDNSVKKSSYHDQIRTWPA
jgi:hypothetical protein